MLIDPVPSFDGHGPEPGADLAAYLGRHGIAATVHRLPKEGKETGEVLRRTATDLGADLIVMGGFGHSRLRERYLRRHDHRHDQVGGGAGADGALRRGEKARESPGWAGARQATEKASFSEAGIRLESGWNPACHLAGCLPGLARVGGPGRRSLSALAERVSGRRVSMVLHAAKDVGSGDAKWIILHISRSPAPISIRRPSSTR